MIVGALLLTIGIKAFPNVASSALAPVQAVMKQADIGTKNADKADNQVINDALGKTSGFRGLLLSHYIGTPCKIAY